MRRSYRGWTLSSVLLALLFLACAAYSQTSDSSANAGLGEKVGALAKGVVAESQDRWAAMLQKFFSVKGIQTLLVFFIGYPFMILVVKLINRNVKDLKPRYLLRNRVIYFTNVVILVSVLAVWVEHIGSITVFLGVVGAGIALALQELLMCTVGFFYIFLKNPYQVGDRIELGGIRGDVIDIRVLQTTLLEIGNWVDSDQSTGRIVNIPNSAVLKREHYNYNLGFEFIWNELKLLITFESDWKKAESIMLRSGIEIASVNEELVKKKIDSMTNHYLIKYGKLTPIVYLNVRSGGLELTLRYLTEARNRRSTQDALLREILAGFKAETDITLSKG
ncbi:MAG: mechanosensitive ion channel family protein [Candidatus Omnitrophica bacterium]|nr:mechanosensitive ion channel family protein [Candidatus Omnitrophota bacterium]